MQESTTRKINITEVDLTTAAVKPTDSTDIAFIPGYTSNPNAPTVPTLCTTLAEFEKHFGDTAATIKGNSIVASGIDRSYIYATELLSYGMPVLYYAFQQDVSVDDAFYSENALIKNVFETISDKSMYSVKYITSGAYPSIARKSQPTYITIPASITFGAGTVPGDLNGDGMLTKEDSNLMCQLLRREISIYDIIQTYANCGTPDIINSDNIVDANDLLELNRQIKNQEPPVLDDDELLPGDINGDGVVDMSDITAVINAASGEELDSDMYPGNPDINGDGVVDMSDITAVINIASGGSINDDDYSSTQNMYSVMYSSATSTTSTDISDVFATHMIKQAQYRGDAVAIIDVQQLNDVPLVDTNATSQVYSALQTLFGGKDAELCSYGTVMYPHKNCYCGSSSKNKGKYNMPASFEYLVCVAKAIKTSPNWLAMAGVTRGRVLPGDLCVPKNHPLTNTVAEYCQPRYGAANHTISVNCITDIQPYGLCLWGNRTLKPLKVDEGVTATCLLNTRNMVSDIKKLLYTTAKSLMFEQNTETLWLRFKSGISPLLNELKTGGAISDYKIIKSDKQERGQLSAIVRVAPIDAIEFFDLTIELTDPDNSQEA